MAGLTAVNNSSWAAPQDASSADALATSTATADANDLAQQPGAANTTRDQAIASDAQAAQQGDAQAEANLQSALDSAAYLVANAGSNVNPYNVILPAIPDAGPMSRRP